MAASLNVYVLFYSNASGGDPLITVTAVRKYVGEIYFTGKYETQRLGHSDSMGCVLVSTSYMLMH